MRIISFSRTSRHGALTLHFAVQCVQTICFPHQTTKKKTWSRNYINRKTQNKRAETRTRIVPYETIRNDAWSRYDHWNPTVTCSTEILSP